MSFKDILMLFQGSYLPLSIIIFIILTLSAYIKIATVLSILRFGFGWFSIPTSSITIALSVSLAFFVMNPLLSELSPHIIKLSKFDTDLENEETSSSINIIESKWVDFLRKNTKDKVLENFQALEKNNNKDGDLDFSTILASFIISQISYAFKIALVLLLPLIVIDILVGVTLTALNIISIYPSMISIPVKMLLFVVVDGWSLIGMNLVGSF